MAATMVSFTLASAVGARAQPQSRARAAPKAAAPLKAARALRAAPAATVFARSPVARTSVRSSAMVVRAARFETERTYVMVKPDGVQRGLVGNIVGRFEQKGFQLKGLKLFQAPKDLAETHYGDLKEKPFFGDLVDYIVSGPVCCMVWEGPGAVKSARKLIGATNPLESEPGTIRGDLAIEVGRNVVHGSDSVENAEKEIGLWFKEGELCDWDQHMMPWLRE